MYYEEQMIDGVMHWRGDPDAEFKPYTLKELSARYADLGNHVSALLGREVECRAGGLAMTEGSQ